MNRRLMMILFVALLMPLVGIFFAGCGGDDNPTDAGNNGGNGTGDTLTTEEVVTEVQTTFSSLEELTVDCDALFLLDAELNLDQFLFLGSVVDSILTDSLGTASLADYYGTWDDTSMAGDYGGVVRINSSPNDAMVLLLDGVDSTGTALTGNLTITSLTRSVDIQARTITYSGQISLNVDGGDSVSLSFSFTVDASLVDEGGLDSLATIPDIDLTMSGNVCGLSFSFTLETTQDGQLSMSGYYEESGDRISFAMSTNVDEQDTCATFQVWEGESQNNTSFYLTTTVCNSDTNCLTGTIEIEGSEEATLYAEDCASDSPSVYMEVDGETFSGEEVFSGLSDIFNSLFGLDSGEMVKTFATDRARVRSSQYNPLHRNRQFALMKEMFFRRN